MLLYISMLLGVFLVLLGKLNKVFHLDTFSWDKFIRTNIVSTGMSLIAGLILVINNADLVVLLHKVSPENPLLSGGLMAAICGIAGMTILQYLVDATNPGKKTSIGL